jgi:hypothetical protein
MRRTVVPFAGLLLVAALPAGARVPADPPVWAPKFRTQEIDTGLSIGYAVMTADLTGDKKPDILVVDQLKVVVYENPTWKKHVILDGKTKPDNVCATVLDVDGDGKLDVVLGAGWKPSDTETPGTLQWLKNPGTLDKEWAMFPIPCDEPTVHRVRNFDIDNDGKPEIVHVPLQGRGATQKGNYTDGRPVRVMAYKLPAEPTKPENWKPVVLSQQLYVVHNFEPVFHPEKGQGIASILTASYDGVHALWMENGKVTEHHHLGKGNQDNPKGNRGASEVRRARIGNPEKPGRSHVAVAIEPWHGNQVVVYPIEAAGDETSPRFVIDDHLRWGHAIQCADLDGADGDEIVIGVRDDPAKGDKFTERRGVRIYKNTDGLGEKWERFILEDGGVAVEDLAVADLDGDGKTDVIACGRATKNVRIYWNQGK